MAHYLRTLMTALAVVVLATAGVIPGEVLCIMPGGDARLEAVGECEEYSASADADGIRPSPDCVDIPLASVAAARPESF